MGFRTTLTLRKFNELETFLSHLKCNFRKITARVSAGRRKQLVVSDMLLFRCSLFKYWVIKLDLVTVEKFCFKF